MDVSHFIKEQRKILKTVRSQPWPMQIKINAVRYDNSIAFLSIVLISV